MRIFCLDIGGKPGTFISLAVHTPRIGEMMIKLIIIYGEPGSTVHEKEACGVSYPWKGNKKEMANNIRHFLTSPPEKYNKVITDAIKHLSDVLIA